MLDIPPGLTVVCSVARTLPRQDFEATDQGTNPGTVAQKPGKRRRGSGRKPGYVCAKT